MIHRWLNRQEVASCGVPVFVPREQEINGKWILGGRWNMPRPAGDILLASRRCEQLGASADPAEQPAGYIYCAKVKDQFRYIPLFSRSMEQLELDKLTPVERRAIEVRQTYAGYGLRRVLEPGAVLICLSCGEDMTQATEDHTCPYCGQSTEQFIISRVFPPSEYIPKGDIDMEAITKLKSEMDGKGTNAYVKLIGDFLIRHIQANPDSANHVLDADKTIAKSLDSMKREAQKQAEGGMAMLTDQEGFAVVLKYFGLEGTPMVQPTDSAPPAKPLGPERKFAVTLDDLL